MTMAKWASRTARSPQRTYPAISSLKTCRVPTTPQAVPCPGCVATLDQRQTVGVSIKGMVSTVQNSAILCKARISRLSCRQREPPDELYGALGSDVVEGRWGHGNC